MLHVSFWFRTDRREKPLFETDAGGARCVCFRHHLRRTGPRTAVCTY